MFSNSSRNCCQTSRKNIDFKCIRNCLIGSKIIRILLSTFVERKAIWFHPDMCRKGNFNYLIAPGIYFSSTRLDVFSIHILYRAFTVLYSHNQHAIVTSVKVFVNIRCFKKWRTFICAINAPSFNKNNRHTTHTVSWSAIILGWQESNFGLHQ